MLIIMNHLLARTITVFRVGYRQCVYQVSRKNVKNIVSPLISHAYYSLIDICCHCISYLFKVVSKAQHAVYTPVLPRMRYARDAFPVDQLAADLQISVPEARVIEQRRAHFAAVMRKALASSSSAASASASAASTTAGIASFFTSSKAKK